MKSILSSLPRSPAQVAERVRSLKSSPAVQATFWVILGSGGYQVIRLFGNLILTRLLFPEIFGIMAIVTAVLVGLGQLSDVGLREGVVNSDRINDPQFMRTAWTLQICRTAVIAILAAIIAFPLANFYDEAVLAPVLMVIACGTFITGFKSIAVLAYDKRLDLKAQMLVDLGVQVAGLVVVIVCAWWWKSIWALVVGHVFASVLDVILSYVLFKGHHSKFAWDKKAVKTLTSFGKWILISSTISYITVQGDRLILGSFLTMGELGIYSVAATWAAIVALLSVNFSTRILHPYFKQVIDDTNSDHSKIKRVRNMLNAAYMVVCVVVALIGDKIIQGFYDDRYLDGGWMLQILALGQVGRALTGTLMPFMLACGDSFSQMKFSAVSAVILIASILLGGWMAGAPGVIVALAFASIASHPVMVAYASKHGYHCTVADFSLITFAAIICFVGWWLTDAPILGVLAELI